MAPRKSSLRVSVAKTRKEGLTAAHSGQAADRIVDLDPALIHAAGLEDRIDINQENIESLAESIRTNGQKVPILVRPHPGRPGKYEVVGGRRRLLACRLAQLNVRAVIQDLDDRDLIMVQAIENIARENLSYIERARLAVGMIDEAGLAAQDIDVAFSCGKTERSRYLKIGRGIPPDILAWVGKAPGIGRPRWEKLADRLGSDGSCIMRIRAVLAAANINNTLLHSDARFAFVSDAAFRSNDPTPGETPARPNTRELRIPSDGKPMGTIKRTSLGVQLTLHHAPAPGFLDWLDRNVDNVIGRLLREYEREAVGDRASRGDQDDNNET